MGVIAVAIGFAMGYNNVSGDLPVQVGGLGLMMFVGGIIGLVFD